jgi:photoactive yellow protein
MHAPELRTPDPDVSELSREDLDRLPYGVITLDRNGTILRYNEAEAAFARRSQVRTVGLNFFADVAPCTNVQAFKGRFDGFAAQRDSGVDRFDFSFAFRWGRHDVSITLLRKSEHDEINVLVRGRTVSALDPAPTPALSVAREPQQPESQAPESTREHELWRTAFYDPLTGLANRSLLLRRIHDAVRETAATGRLAAIVFIDLDRFKAVNDTFGHAVGDKVLRAVALRLGESVRGGDTLARINGDEFVALLTDMEDVPTIDRTVRGLLTDASAPIDVDGRLHYVSASVGISLLPYHGTDPIALLHAADTAMYAAKAIGRNTFQWFTAEMSEAIAANLQVEEELRGALQRNELTVHYQPIVDGKNGAVVAAEALVRWNHPTRGLMMPGQFITVAERSGLIVPLGEFVLREACRQVQRWTAAGRDLRVCVNVSTRQFRQKNFAGGVRAILEETGVPAQRIELELTESMMIDGFDETIEALTELKLLGIRLAVDDFGTGYSSLAYLKYLPVDTLKLDRAFVVGIAVDAFDRAIATAVLALARDLKLECIAEGIETEEQARILRELGCPLLQGYLFGRPQPPEALRNAEPEPS